MLLTLCTLAAVAIAVALWMTLNVYGTSGARWVPSGVPFVDQVAGIQPGSPAEGAGLRVGDRLDIRDLSPEVRLRDRNGLVMGQTVVLPIQRGGMRRTATLAPWPETKSTFWHDDAWDQVLSIVGEFWWVFVAALIVWRRPDSNEAQLLALLLVLSMLGTAIAPQLNSWVSPWPALDLVAYALSQTLGALGTVLLATYALQFGRPISRARRFLTWTAYAIAALTAIVGIVGILGEWLGTIDSQSWFFAQTAPSIALALASSVLPVACAGFALRDARGTERARLAWAAGSLSINYLAGAVWATTQILGTFTHIGTVLVDITVFLSPLGLTYALLSRSLLDVGFVLNRAAVFAVTSLLLAGLFAGLQWVANTYLTGLFGVHNVAVDMTIVVAIYYAIRFSRQQTDAIVSRLLFGPRNRRMQALREIPNMIDEISDAEAIAPLTVKYLRTMANIEAHVSWQDSDGELTPAEDPEWRTSSVAFPMLVRGHLRGTLFCQAPDDGEYAPDETLALEQLAYRLATDRDDILAASLRAELNALRSHEDYPRSASQAEMSAISRREIA